MDKPKGRIYFDPLKGHFTHGTFKDLEQEQMTPVEGMTLHFWNDDADEEGNQANLIFEGVIHFDKESGRWFAVVDEKSYRHESDDSRSAESKRDTI